MWFWRYCLLPVLAVLSHMPRRYSESWASSVATKSPLCSSSPPGPIQNSQPLAGDPYTGNAVQEKPIRPKFQYFPRISNLHLDGGNTNSQDFPGPLGYNLSVTSANIGLDILLWDEKGRLTAAYYQQCNDSGTPVQAVVIINPQTLDVEAEWLPPVLDDKLNFAYMEQRTETDEIVVSSQKGQIYVLKRIEQADQPSLQLTRHVDLASEGVLQGISLLLAMDDSDGNIWFTTGGIRGLGQAAQPAAIVGYIEPNGTIHSMEVPNQMAENGMSVSNTTVFFLTGPSKEDDHENTVGFLSALRPGPGTSITVLWNATYQAGNGTKPGGWARGSGSTPALLGNDYVTITDNDDPQINLLVFRQEGNGDQEPICKIPLFAPEPSANDNGPVIHFDGKDYSVLIQNMYNEPDYLAISSEGINGAYNNMTVMAPGITKVTVAGDGSGCSVNWTIPIRMTTLPVLSTSTGLVYGHVQAEKLANDGQYIWYTTAIDYISGETVWQVRAGAGGAFNDVYHNMNLSPDGTLYQLVRDGVVMVKDGPHM